MKKLLMTLAALTITASAASAQSFCTCDGTGNVLKFTNNPITYENHAAAVTGARPSGLDALAMTPGRGAPVTSDDPAATGGGSLGYNELLGTY